MVMATGRSSRRGWQHDLHALAARVGTPTVAVMFRRFAGALNSRQDLPKRRHQSKSANRSGSQCQPECVSTNASPGRLMHTSVMFGLPRRGRSARRLRSSADASTGAALVSVQLINRPEVEVARNEYLDSIPLVLDERRRDVDRAFQDLGHDIHCRGWTVDYGAAATRMQR